MKPPHARAGQAPSAARTLSPGSEAGTQPRRHARPVPIRPDPRPHRHRAGGGHPRQPGPGHRPGHRQALLRLVEPGRHRLDHLHDGVGVPHVHYVSHRSATILFQPPHRGISPVGVKVGHNDRRAFRCEPRPEAPADAGPTLAAPERPDTPAPLEVSGTVTTQIDEATDLWSDLNQGTEHSTHVLRVDWGDTSEGTVRIPIQKTYHPPDAVDLPGRPDRARVREPRPHRRPPPW